MSDDAEIERALIEVTTKQNAFETQLQNLRDTEAAAIAVMRAQADAYNARLTALDRERLALVQRTNEMNSKRRAVLGLARQSARVAQGLIRAALFASLMLGFLMLSTVDRLSGGLVFAFVVACGVAAAFVGDAADHSELQ
jgi:predicted phage tail protein